MKGSRIKLRIAGLTGFLGVGLGAFGAHALKGVLEESGYLETWQTAVFYHLVHAVVLLILAIGSVPRSGTAYWCFLSGIVIFCGSLYLLAVSGASILGAITPIGGLAFLLGWGLYILGWFA